MTPILTRSEVTGSVYIATKYKTLDDGVIDTQEKYDVTDQFDRMSGRAITRNERLTEYVRWLEERIVDSAHIRGNEERALHELRAKRRELGVDDD